jgi:hypothetical protein
MDPNEVLNKIRRLIAERETCYEDDEKGMSNEIVEQFIALDEWLARGGFKPGDWDYDEPKW